ncbi:glycosyltransferase family protein [Subtercola endophyticus]|uniref:glycosyltransferase family 39 protein n=1 Tax=Subtercola endophyticus TaxID=2895559 RepID=UPI001E48BDCF|nr:glycosyltransferase family 39 protein [Subtercola endophyticus]UFS57823.1 glycosyltransferase family 39 protein [Subtercola endophyticus]
MHRRFLWAAGLIIAGGVALRVALALSPGFVVDSDRAIVYLMAVHASHGDLTVVYWGQQYGGSLLSLVSGAVMAVVGESPYVVYGVVLAMMAASALLLCRLTRLALGRVTALVATALFMFPGTFLTRQTLDDGGFYMSTVLFALLAIWFAVDHPLRAPRWRMLGVGLSVGIALWCSPMGFALAAPALGVALYRRRRISTALLMLPGLALGAAAFAAGELQFRAAGSGWAQQVTLFDGAVERAHQLFFGLIPAGLPFGIGSLRAVVALVVLALIVVLLIGAFRDKSGITFAFAAGVVLLTVVLVLSGTTLIDAAARYVEFYLPALAFAAAAVIVRVSAGVAVLAGRGRAGSRDGEEGAGDDTVGEHADASESDGTAGAVTGAGVGTVGAAAGPGVGAARESAGPGDHGSDGTPGVSVPAPVPAPRPTPRRPARVLLGALATVTVVAAIVISVRGTYLIGSGTTQTGGSRGTIAAADTPSAAAVPVAGLRLFGGDAIAVDNLLEARGISAVWAAYWISYRLAAASGERVVAADIELRRYAPYVQRASAVDPAAVVEPTGSGAEQALSASTDLPYAERETVAGMTVFIYDHPVTAERLGRVIGMA